VIDEPPFALTEGEKSSGLWIRLSGHLETKLREARGKNDGPQSEQDTAMLRGKISTLKALIALGDESPPQDG
jgi:hypothetical protein